MEVVPGTEGSQLPTQNQEVLDPKGLAYSEANSNQSDVEYKTLAAEALMTGKATPAQVIQSGMMTPEEVRQVVEALNQASMSNGPQDGGLAARGMVR